MRTVPRSGTGVVTLYWFYLDSCEHGNEPSDSIRGEKFLDYVQILKVTFVESRSRFRLREYLNI
jgi:hypothetical protein